MQDIHIVTTDFIMLAPEMFPVADITWKVQSRSLIVKGS